MSQPNSYSRVRSPMRIERGNSIISFMGTSQYSAGSSSACGLASVNAVRTILTQADGTSSVREALRKEETAMSIMAICQFWTSTEHLEVQDILDLPLFQCQLETVDFEEKQATLSNFRMLARSLTEQGACAAVVTRAPEIVSLMNIPAEREGMGDLLVIFDSHNRPEHPLGAAFLLFQSPDEAAAYLSKLFAVDASIMRDSNWQTQMLSHYSAHVMKARSFTEEEHEQALYTANIRLLKISAQMKEAEDLESLTKLEVNATRQKLDDQREARRQASLAEEEANRRLRALRKELEAARELARSLSGPVQVQTDQWKGHSAPIDYPRFDRPATYHVSDTRSKGKMVDRNGDAPIANKPSKLQKSGPSKHQYQLKTTSTMSEAEEYERVRQEHIAAKAAERKEKLQAEKERAQRQAQMESERNDFDIALQLYMEEQRALAEQAQLLAAADAGFDCPICMETWSIGMQSKIDSCGHAICRTCMVSAVKAVLESRRWPVTCPLCVSSPPENGEPGVVTREVFELAGAEENDLKTWTTVELASVSVNVECPTCHRVSRIDQEDYGTTLMLWCMYGDCDAYWCKTCSQLAERGKKHTCDGQAEFERWREGQKDVRDCPGCKTPIQRWTGCRHMTCTSPGCNTHFCDRCGQLIIKSQKKRDIDIALEKHYNNCDLFDVPS